MGGNPGLMLFTARFGPRNSSSHFHGERQARWISWLLLSQYPSSQSIEIVHWTILNVRGAAVQQNGQNGDDGDHHQSFDKGKSAPQPDR
ncbi:MAG: hypothetical protein WCT12_07700 [Verrucomicrobiota bacterium]